MGPKSETTTASYGRIPNCVIKSLKCCIKKLLCCKHFLSNLARTNDFLFNCIITKVLNITSTYALVTSVIIFWQVIIFFTDHKTSSKHASDLVEAQVKAMKDIKLLPVAIGSHVNIRELEKITGYSQEIIHFSACEKPDTVSTRIWHGTEKNVNLIYLSLGRCLFLM